MAHPDPDTKRQNTGVSRVHARIVFDAKRGCFCWENDQGRTRLKRPAFAHPQEVGGRMPFPLSDRDRLFLGAGDAVLRVEIDTGSGDG